MSAAQWTSLGEDGVFEVFTDVYELSAVRDALEGKGYVFLSAEVEKIPSTYVRLRTRR